ncbi:recombinase family protein [Streptomyces sp. NPDC090106]|uniref:recombinase family protein n=1 Tax=Streptomyces sp. NPDC090106 TaxID=3365946 RepID=UPI003808AD96
MDDECIEDEPLTERRPVTGPHVFGYLRHSTGGTPRHTALTNCLTEYCRSHELTLCGVFTDREPAVALHSPAFVGLLDALGLPDTYGAVIPALSHLGPRPVATERRRRITATGTRLITVRSTRPTAGIGLSFRLQQQGGT